MRKLLFVFSIVWFVPQVVLALWAEPACDPAIDPTACNISVPLNVSNSNQTKEGGLTINGTLTANGPSIFSNLGSITADGPVLIRGPLNIQNTTIFSNPYPVTVNGTFTYAGVNSGFVLTADSIDDNEVSNTLTASIFQGTGSTSDLVDLASEVNTIGETWVDTTGDTMTGTLTLAPASSVDALTITPNSTQEAVYISGSSNRPLVSLNPTGTVGGSLGLYVNMTTGSANGINANSTTTGYPIYATANSATRSIYATNSRVSGYAIYGVATNTTSYGVGGSGTSAGIIGSSVNGYGGSFSSATTTGSALYTALTSASTTATSKALEVVGKNGYGGYFTSDGNSSTSLYVENTNNVAGFNKFGIQTIATTPAGVGIAATSDYGIAGEFNSTSGGVGVSINVADFGTAIDANGGVIKDVVGYSGGQFYPNEQPSTAVYSNEKIQIISLESLRGNAEDLFFDGDSIWHTDMFTVFTTDYNGYEQHSLRDGHSIDSATLWYSDTIEINMATDTLYFFTDSGDYYTKDRLDGSESSSTLSSSITINSSAFDGEDMWFGTNSSIYQWGNLSTLTSRASGLGTIVDMVYANGYLWAVDSSNDVVYKMDTSSYSSTSISVSDNPQAIVFDGQSLWVANYNDTTLTRINVNTNDTTSYSVSPGGSNPQALTFDGSNIWIGYGNSGGVAAFNVAQETITRSSALLGTGIAQLAFDGTYIWAATENAYLLQLNSGSGFGSNSEPITDGILLYNTSGSVRCLYVSGTTVTASSTLTNCQ